MGLPVGALHRSRRSAWPPCRALGLGLGLGLGSRLLLGFRPGFWLGFDLIWLDFGFWLDFGLDLDFGLIWILI